MEQRVALPLTPLEDRADVDAALADLRRDGVAVIRDLIPQDVVAALQAEWRRVSAEIAEGTSALQRAARFVYGADLPGALDEIPSHPALVAVAKKFIGPDVALYFNRLLVKDHVWNGPVAAHQDAPYFHGSTDKLSIFLPLEPFTRASGNLSFVAGSNRFGNLGQRGTITYQDFPEMPIVTPEAYPGDVILATFTVWHFSEAATQAGDRPVMQIAYQPASDGSYFGEPAQPRLICGQWSTESFIKFKDHIVLDT